MFAIALAVLVTFLAPVVDDRPSREPRASNGRRPPLSLALKLLAVGGACGGAAGNGLSLFFVPAAVDIGITEARAGAILAVASASVFLLRVAVGAFADRVGSTGHGEMMVILALGAVASFGLAFVNSADAFVIVMPLALLGSWGWPGLIYFTVVRIHPEATARASGVILASNLTGTLVGPSVVGLPWRRTQCLNSTCGSLDSTWSQLLHSVWSHVVRSSVRRPGNPSVKRCLPLPVRVAVVEQAS